MSAAVQLNFDNLPLVEAAIRTSFRTPVRLSFAILNRLRDKLGSEFQNLDEISQIEVPPGVNIEMTLTVGQIPGAILTGNSFGLRTTVQQSVVVSRWVLDPLRDSPGYPRFGPLRDSHWRVVSGLLEAGGAQNQQFGAVNMSYSNFLNIGGSPDVLERYFSPNAQVALVKSPSQFHKIELAWQESSSIDLRFQLERVRARIGDQTNDGYNLTTVAGSAAASKPDAEEKLDIVHGRLQQFFVDLISDTAKKEWGLRA